MTEPEVVSGGQQLTDVGEMFPSDPGAQPTQWPSCTAPTVPVAAASALREPPPPPPVTLESEVGCGNDEMMQSTITGDQLASACHLSGLPSDVVSCGDLLTSGSAVDVVHRPKLLSVAEALFSMGDFRGVVCAGGSAPTGELPAVVGGETGALDAREQQGREASCFAEGYKDAAVGWSGVRDGSVGDLVDASGREYAASIRGLSPHAPCLLAMEVFRQAVDTPEASLVELCQLSIPVRGSVS